MLLLIGLFAIIIYLSVAAIRNKKNTKNSFSYGLALSAIVYLLSSFLFFWFAVFRRMSVLKVPFNFDSDVAFATILVPVMVALPWLPFGIITGFVSLKKGNKTALQFLYIFTILISIGLAIVFWKLPYN